MVTLGTNNPYDSVVRSIGGRDPRRTLATLAHAPGGNDVGRICSGDLVGLNLTPRAKNKVCSLRRRVGSRRLTPERAINT